MHLLHRGRGGWELPPVATVKATQEEFFYTETLLENQAAGESQSLVEHKSTESASLSIMPATGHKREELQGVILDDGDLSSSVYAEGL